MRSTARLHRKFGLYSLEELDAVIWNSCGVVKSHHQLPRTALRVGMPVDQDELDLLRSHGSFIPDSGRSILHGGCFLISFLSLSWWFIENL